MTVEERTYELKTLKPFFAHVLEGDKTFEIRKDDWGYRYGDILLLKEWDGRQFTGRELRRRITYVLSGLGLAQGHVCMGLGPLNPKNITRLAYGRAVARRVAMEAHGAGGLLSDEEAEAIAEEVQRADG